MEYHLGSNHFSLFQTEFVLEYFIRSQICTGQINMAVHRDQIDCQTASEH